MPASVFNSKPFTLSIERSSRRMNRFERWYWLPHLDNHQRLTIWRMRFWFAVGLVAVGAISLLVTTGLLYQVITAIQRLITLLRVMQ